MIENSEGARTTPSVVAITEDGNRLVKALFLDFGNRHQILIQLHLRAHSTEHGNAAHFFDQVPDRLADHLTLLSVFPVEGAQ